MTPTNIAYLFLENLPAKQWLTLDELKIKDKPKFIQLAKFWIDLSYQVHFNDDFTSIYKVCGLFPDNK